MVYKLVVFVPECYKEIVKKSLFGAGAGRYEKYDNCSFEVKGEGQFRPLEGSEPFVGRKGVVEQVVEYRIEMLCKESLIDDVVKALRKSHPYEEPAFEYWKVAIK